MSESEFVYHIIIFWKNNPFEPKAFGRFDMSIQTLNSSYVSPYLKQRTLLLDGKKVNHTSVDRISVFKSPPGLKGGVMPVKSELVGSDDIGKWSKLREFALKHWDDVTNEVLKVDGSTSLVQGGLDGSSTTRNDPMANKPSSSQRDVFVVHGRMTDVRDAMFALLKSAGLNPMPWEEFVGHSGTASPSNLQAVLAGARKAHAFVVIITPEDLGQLHPSLVSKQAQEYENRLTPQPRLNVVFEAGIAMGMLPDRTVVVEFVKTRPFSDLTVNTVRFTRENQIEKRKTVLTRLKNQGLDVSFESDDWKTAGNFPFERIESLSQVVEHVDVSRHSRTKWIPQFEELFSEIGNAEYVEPNQIARYEDLLRKSGLYEDNISDLILCSPDYVPTTISEPYFNKVIGGIEGSRDVAGPRRVVGRNLRYKIQDAKMYLTGELKAD